MPIHDYPIEIVCFGDSLTLGFQTPTSADPHVLNIAYGVYLQKYLGTRGKVYTRGACGETTQDMRDRFAKDVLERDPDYVIILGGTNDLGWGINPTFVVENLSFLYAQAKQAGIRPVAVTVPSIAKAAGEIEGSETGEFTGEFFSVALAARQQLNQAIMQICSESEIPVVDLFTETCESNTGALAPLYSNDGLHLTTAGYQKLAELLWTRVFSEQ